MDKVPKKLLKVPKKTKKTKEPKVPKVPKEPKKPKVPKEPKKPKVPKVQVKPKANGITLQYDEVTVKNEIDENKYSERIKEVLLKIKNQNTDIDNRIRFCWKN